MNDDSNDGEYDDDFEDEPAGLAGSQRVSPIGHQKYTRSGYYSQTNPNRSPTNRMTNRSQTEHTGMRAAAVNRTTNHEKESSNMQNTARSSCSLITVNSVVTNPLMSQTQ